MVFPLIATALASGAAGIYSSNKASSSQKFGIKADIDFRKKSKAEALHYHQPYMEQGKNYLNMYADMMGMNGQTGAQSALDKYKMSPSYQLLQDAVGQSTEQVKATMAANGMLDSGAYGKELMGHISPTILGDYYRYQTGIGSGVDMGRAATGAATGVIQNTSTGVGNALSRYGTAQASGYVGANNAIQGGIKNAMSAYMWDQGRNAVGAGGYPLQYDPNWGQSSMSIM